MDQVAYSQMDGVQVLWHMISTGEPGLMAIIGLGLFFLVFSLIYDRYFEDPEVTKVTHKTHRDHGQY